MILILGGTTESREISRALNKKNIGYVMSTVTDTQQREDENHFMESYVTNFDRNSLEKFVKDRSIKTIIDATHPFAVKIKEISMDVSKKLGVKYIRYEREKVLLPENEKIKKAVNLEEAMNIISSMDGNILVTTGIKELPYIFAKLKTRKNDIYVRVLPHSESLLICEALKIPLSHIIAMMGPFDKDFNDYIIKKYKINVVLTKNSGREGGLLEKINSAIDNSAYIVVVMPPQFQYPSIAENLDQLFGIIEKYD